MMQRRLEPELKNGDTQVQAYAAADFSSGDQATIMAYVLVTALIFMLVNLAVDIAYAYLDRRVVLGG